MEEFERVESMMDSGIVPDLWQWEDLCPSVVVLTGGALLVVACHEWRDMIGPCHGVDCWHCDASNPVVPVGIGSGVVLRGRSGVPFFIPALLEFRGQDTLASLRQHAKYREMFRETLVLVTRDGTVMPFVSPEPMWNDLPGGLEPLTYALRYYGPHATYTLMGPEFDAPIARHHLPRPPRIRRFQLADGANHE